MRDCPGMPEAVAKANPYVKYINEGPFPPQFIEKMEHLLDRRLRPQKPGPKKEKDK